MSSAIALYNSLSSTVLFDQYVPDLAASNVPLSIDGTFVVLVVVPDIVPVCIQLFTQAFSFPYLGCIRDNQVSVMPPIVK